MRQLKSKHEFAYDNLPEEQREIIQDLLIEALEDVEGWRHDLKEYVEAIEYKSRSGFIANSDNYGGIQINQFTDLQAMWGSGNRVSHVKAQAEIERQIEYGLKCAQESYFENNKEELKAIGINSASEVSYHGLIECGQESMAEDFSQYESENLSDESSSIMFQVRFLYHGVDSMGIHSASVSCAVNTEGPYHRSHISWAPNVFCEGAKETTISWRKTSGLKQKLKATLKFNSSVVF